MLRRAVFSNNVVNNKKKKKNKVCAWKVTCAHDVCVYVHMYMWQLAVHTKGIVAQDVASMIQDVLI